uniref:Uncharacterized protein n=1 Tax=Coccidioides posadasii RMSCC 3488 TaxID=454284 RepID=A0A0J6FJG4_COCPO|nr:hypothetical protein CPAG_05860 [Coccidioides posadasii RMSCC 3488]
MANIRKHPGSVTKLLLNFEVLEFNPKRLTSSFCIEDAKDIVIIQRAFTPISYQRFPFSQTRVPQCLVVNRCSASVCFSPRPSD